jgi:flavoprotein
MRACDYNIYRIKYKSTYAERHQEYPGSDPELTGRYITDEYEYLCVAPDDSFAMTAYLRYHTDDTFIKLELIGKLDDLVYLQ